MADALTRILYLEDVGPIAEVGIMALEEFGGFEVRHCFTGRDAIAAIDGFNPQLLLFDVMLPDMDGLQTLEKIRAMPAGQSLPVIFMTAKAQVHEQQSYKGEGVLGVIIKPFDPIVVSDTIREMWATRSGEQVA